MNHDGDLTYSVVDLPQKASYLERAFPISKGSQPSIYAVYFKNTELPVG